MCLGPGDVAVLAKGVMHDVVPPTCEDGSRLTFIAFYGAPGDVAAAKRATIAVAKKRKRV